MSSSAERKSIRVNLKVEIDIHSETNFYTGFSENISSGGIFIATHFPAKIGEKVPLVFKLPNSPRSLEVVGTVRWFREYNPFTPNISPGMGLLFEELSEEDAEIINEYITEYREPYFHPEEDDDE